MKGFAPGLALKQRREIAYSFVEWDYFGLSRQAPVYGNTLGSFSKLKRLIGFLQQ